MKLPTVRDNIWYTQYFVKYRIFCAFVILCAITINKTHLWGKQQYLLFYIRHSPTCFGSPSWWFGWKWGKLENVSNKIRDINIYLISVFCWWLINILVSTSIPHFKLLVRVDSPFIVFVPGFVKIDQHTQEEKEETTQITWWYYTHISG